MLKRSYLTLCVAAALCSSGYLVQAADMYLLNEIVVTATRSAKEQVDIPMSTDTITTEDLKESGATNAQLALSTLTGIPFKQFGPGGGHMGTMNTEIAMRGIGNGTLVLVNGNPVSARGKYFLDSIPAERIERIEVIKGGGSVLYGSEAMAGVINIITKDSASNSLRVGFGNFGQQLYDVEAGTDRLQVAVHRERWGMVDYLNDMDKYRQADSPRTLKESAHIGYKLSDNLRFEYDWRISESDYLYWFKQVPPELAGIAEYGDEQQHRRYGTRQSMYQLNYADGDWTARAYYNRVHITNHGWDVFKTKKDVGYVPTNKPYDSDEINTNYGLDIQRTQIVSDKLTLIYGLTYQREAFDKSVYKSGDVFERNIYAFYAQAETKASDRDTLILSGRKTWTGGAPEGLNYHNFSAAGQWLHEINPQENLYLNISQSFIMPTFSQMFGTGGLSEPNPGLKPQHGINYEIGYKKVHDKHAYKIAVYKMNISDNIKVNVNRDKFGNITDYQYGNSDFKNKGIEAEMSYRGDNHWSYRLGISYNDPWNRDTGKIAKKPYWDRLYGRWQVTGGATYQNGPWTSNFTLSYLADRVGSPSSEHSSYVSPYLLTTWNTQYRLNDSSTIALRIDNVLDRNDNLSHSGSFYRATPFNYLLSYQYEF